MGNKVGRERQDVDERYTQPQGPYRIKDVDHKKLRKLILNSKLAPCYPGDEECSRDLEECPICFLNYPSLNRSRCCRKAICTECFLQIKPPCTSRPARCPFCKASYYSVVYRGMRTQKEKDIEEMEEQRVIEAKIRMQQQALENEEKRMQRGRDASSSSRAMTVREAEYQNIPNSSFSVSQTSSTLPASRQPPQLSKNREEYFFLYLEDIMDTEVIWASIQEQRNQRNPFGEGCTSSRPSSLEDHENSEPTTYEETVPSVRFAHAVAASAKCQHMNMDYPNTSRSAHVFNVIQNSCTSSPRKSSIEGERAMNGGS